MEIISQAATVAPIVDTVLMILAEDGVAEEAITTLHFMIGAQAKERLVGHLDMGVQRLTVG